MKKVIFHYCRHGQTLFNQMERMQGFCDSPLTETGIQNAKDAHQILLDVPIKHAYTSTSERCVDTAHIILEGRDIPLTYDKRLKELNFGSHEGLDISSNLEEIDKIRKGTLDWTIVGGENTEQLKKRICEVLDEIYEQSEDGDTVLIVSHGLVFMQMLDFLFGIDFRTLIQPGVMISPVPNGYVGSFDRIGNEYHLISLANQK